MEDPIPQTATAQQIAGFLEQAQAEARLDEELAFWADVLQGLGELYQEDQQSNPIIPPRDTLELPESPQAIKALTGDKAHRSKRKFETTATSSLKSQLHHTPSQTSAAKNTPRLAGTVRAPGLPNEPVTKRAKKHTSTFATRAAECQEQDAVHQGLLARASRWESVVSKAVDELNSQNPGQTGAVDDQSNARGKRGRKQPSRQARRGNRSDQWQAASDPKSVQVATENQVLYFCRMFGKPGRQRLRDILRSIRQHQSEGKLLSDQSEIHNGLEHGSRSLREWIDSVQRQDQARTVELGVAFQRYLLGAQQYEKWRALLQAAEDPSSETYTQMHALGLTTSQGRDVRTNVKAYFLNYTKGFDIREAAAKEADMTNPELAKARNSLQNTIATGRTYYVLQEVFGPGVFLLLPEQAPGYFRNNWSKASLEVVTDTVAALIPDTRRYCARLSDLVLKPLTESRAVPPLKIEVARGRSSHGLLDLLQPQDGPTVSVGIDDPPIKASAIEAAPNTGQQAPRVIAQDTAETTVADSPKIDNTGKEGQLKGTSSDSKQSPDGIGLGQGTLVEIQ